jgi:hypothetical protein
MTDMNAVFGHKGDGFGSLIPPSTTPVGTFSTYGVFDSSGFLDAYKDPDPKNDQIHHFWYFIQFSYFHGLQLADVLNKFHEGWPSQGGKSTNDYWLSAMAIYLGTGLREGEIKPEDVSSWISNWVSENTTNQDHWIDPY